MLKLCRNGGGVIGRLELFRWLHLYWHLLKTVPSLCLRPEACHHNIFKSIGFGMESQYWKKMKEVIAREEGE